MTNTLCYIFAMIGTLLMFIGQGITEGFTFATSERRRENKIIRNKYSDKTSKGFFIIPRSKSIYGESGVSTISSICFLHKH